MWKYVFLGVTLFAALPATSNYKLNSYGFGSGGTAGSSTATYSLEGTTGEFSASTAATVNNKAKPGFVETEQANVPKIVTLDNNGGLYYNRLHFVIDTQNNPTDAKYLISVSTDNFVSNVTYLQPDGTLSASLLTSDYQTYSSWGGASGSLIIGLTPGTTYYVRAKATQGKFTESAYGPANSAATSSPSLTFNLVTSATSTPPFTANLGSLNAGTIATAPQTINTTLTTNGASGGDVYIKSTNGGLLSSSTSNIITAATADLASVSRGFGAQNTSVTQSSGGPYAVQSPYNGSSGNVGIVSGTTRSLYSSNAPVTGGAGVLSLKAKSATTDAAATDYVDVLTFLAAGNF